MLCNTQSGVLHPYSGICDSAEITQSSPTYSSPCTVFMDRQKTLCCPSHLPPLSLTQVPFPTLQSVDPASQLFILCHPDQNSRSPSSLPRPPPLA